MFLCDRCHDVAAHLRAVPDRSLLESWGRCEACGQSAPCIDCHRLPCAAPTPAARRP